MSAAFDPEARHLVPLQEREIDAVVAIEAQCYEFPWTRGNFLDSYRVGYEMHGLHLPGAGLVGYVVAMWGVEELHLLNITVSPAQQGRGHARWMLDVLRRMAVSKRAAQLWLEVRVSNERARRLYETCGFVKAGLRRGYYPAAEGRREDALVMSLRLPEVSHGLG